jgi:hypothetical protein
VPYNSLRYLPDFGEIPSEFVQSRWNEYPSLNRYPTNCKRTVGVSCPAR